MMSNNNDNDCDDGLPSLLLKKVSSKNFVKVEEEEHKPTEMIENKEKKDDEEEEDKLPEPVFSWNKKEDYHRPVLFWKIWSRPVIIRGRRLKKMKRSFNLTKSTSPSQAAATVRWLRTFFRGDCMTN